MIRCRIIWQRMAHDGTSSYPIIRPKFEALSVHACKYPGVDMKAVETGITFLQASSAVFAAFDAHYARHGMSRGRFLVLVLLVQEGPDGLSPAELAERTYVTRATMTGLIDTLEHSGYVERRDDPSDRRMCRVCITEKGRAFLDGMFPEHFRRMAALVANLSNDDREKLIELLHKLERGVEAVRIE